MAAPVPAAQAAPQAPQTEAREESGLMLHRPPDRRTRPITSTIPMPHRPEVHRWYCTAGWQRRRRHQLHIEPLCRLCLEAGRVTPATVADHVEPHRGDLTRSSSVRSAACAPTATMGSTGIMPRAHRSARTAPLPTRTIRGTRARRGRPSTPAAYCGEVVSRAAGAGIKRLEAAEHRPRPAGRDFKRDAT